MHKSCVVHNNYYMVIIVTFIHLVFEYCWSQLNLNVIHKCGMKTRAVVLMYKTSAVKGSAVSQCVSGEMCSGQRHLSDPNGKPQFTEFSPSSFRVICGLWGSQPWRWQKEPLVSAAVPQVMPYTASAPMVLQDLWKHCYPGKSISSKLTQQKRKMPLWKSLISPESITDMSWEMYISLEWKPW